MEEWNADDTDFTDWRGQEIFSVLIREIRVIRVLLQQHRLLVDAAVGGVNDAEHLLDGRFRLALRVNDAVVELHRPFHLLAGGGRAQRHALGRVLLALL